MEKLKGDKYFDFSREQEKLWNIKVMVIQIVISEGTGRIFNKNTSGNHSNDSTVNIV